MIINEELINSFLSFYKNEGLKERTIENYRYDFNCFLQWFYENKKDKVEDINKILIEDYKQHLFNLSGSKYSRYWIQDGLCSWTINKKLLVIKKFLEYTNYVFDAWLDASKIRLNKAKYKRGDYFESEEIKLIYKAVEHTEKYKINQLRAKLIILLCYVSGARCNEMRQITIEGIKNWKQKITWKWSKDRWIFFNEECSKLLEEYLIEQHKPLPWIWKTAKRINNELAIIGHWFENFWTAIWKQAVCEIFKKLNDYLKENYNREKTITCHTLRHSFATTMVNKWINPFYLKELMWHEKLNTTAVYFHENWSLLQQVQEKTFSDFVI